MNQIQIVDVAKNEIIVAHIGQFNQMRKDFLAGLLITKETVGGATDCLRLIKLSIKKIEEERKKITVPMDEAKKAVMDQVKKVLEPLIYEKDSLEKKLLGYQQEKRRIEEENYRIQKKLEEDKLKIIRDEQFEQAELNESELALDDAIATQKEIDRLENMEIKTTGIVRGQMSSTSIVVTWDFKLVNIKEVPIQYLMLNESLIRAVIKGKNGLHEIPGLTIFEKERLQTRG